MSSNDPPSALRRAPDSRRPARTSGASRDAKRAALAEGALRRTRDRIATSNGNIHPFIWLMFAAMMLPVELSVQVGSLSLSPFKIIMVCITFPVLFQFTQKCRFGLLDGLFFTYALYSAMCILINRGFNGIETSAIFFMETVVVYAATRVAIQSVADMRAVLILFITIIGIMGILAVPEAILHRRFLHEIPQMLTGYWYFHATDTRFGMLRANATFEHPILFGLAAAALVSYAWIFARSVINRVRMLAGLALASVFSLSSVAFLVFFMQIGIIAAERLTRVVPRRGLFLCSGVILILTFLSIASDRGPVGLLASYLTFNPHTGYYRILIWNHGIDDVLANPIFGMRQEEWTRPHWMTASIDNNWLIIMMRGGFPSLIFFSLFLIIAMVRVAYMPNPYDLERPKTQETPREARLRKRDRQTESAPEPGTLLPDAPTLDVRNGWIITMIALGLGGATVTFFGQMVPIYTFQLALGPALLALAAPKEAITRRPSGEGRARSSRHDIRRAET